MAHFRQSRNLNLEIWPKVSTQLNFWEKHDKSRIHQKHIQVKAQGLNVPNPPFKSQFGFYPSCLARSRVWYSTGHKSISRSPNENLSTSGGHSILFSIVCSSWIIISSSLAVVKSEMVVSRNTSILGRYIRETLKYAWWRHQNRQLQLVVWPRNKIQID